MVLSSSQGCKKGKAVRKFARNGKVFMQVFYKIKLSIVTFELLQFYAVFTENTMRQNQFLLQ